jgi:hypothetical protein
MHRSYSPTAALASAALLMTALGAAAKGTCQGPIRR